MSGQGPVDSRYPYVKVVNTDENCDFVASFLDFMTNVCKVRFQPTAFDDVGHNLLGYDK